MNRQNKELEREAPHPEVSDCADDPLERLAAMVAWQEELVLPSGRRAVFEASEEERLTIVGPAGGAEVTVHFTPQGPVVRVSAAALEVQSQGAVTVDCERFQVRARMDLELRAGGDLHEIAGGRHVLQAEDAVEITGATVAVSARQSIGVEAEKEVFINGENLYLNC